MQKVLIKEEECQEKGCWFLISYTVTQHPTSFQAHNLVLPAISHSESVCLQGFVIKNIKNDCPLSMIEFSVAISYEHAVWSFPANVVCRKGSGGVWEPSFKLFEFPIACKGEVLTLTKQAMCLNTSWYRLDFYTSAHFWLQDKETKA
jgi:hypothetical protein